MSLLLTILGCVLLYFGVRGALAYVNWTPPLFARKFARRAAVQTKGVMGVPSISTAPESIDEEFWAQESDK